MIRLTRNNHNFEAVSWVVKGVADKGETRRSLKCLQVKDGVITSTNGHIALRAKLEKPNYIPITVIENGLYEVIKATKSEIIMDETTEELTFPNVDQVIPDCVDMPFLVNSSNSGFFSNRFVVTTDLIRVLPAGCTVNYDYIGTILNGGAWVEFVAYKDIGKPIVFSGESRVAVLQPMRY